MVDVPNPHTRHRPRSYERQANLVNLQNYLRGHPGIRLRSCLHRFTRSRFFSLTHRLDLLDPRQVEFWFNRSENDLEDLIRADVRSLIGWDERTDEHIERPTDQQMFELRRRLGELVYAWEQMRDQTTSKRVLAAASTA